jgi:8-amino-7-oxononanoate synthase
VILGSLELRDCLVNFAQSFIHRAFTAFRCSDFDGYQHLERIRPVLKLRENIIHFNQERHVGLKQLFVHSKSAIQSAIIP